MNTSIGNQGFGPWYDIIFYVILSGWLFRFAFAQASFPVAVKQRIPPFLGKWPCILMGVVAAGLAVVAFASRH